MKPSFAIFLLFVAFPLCLCAKSYENYKVYQVNPVKEDDLKVLIPWTEKENVDFWDTSNQPRIMISPTGQAEFEEFLTENNLPFTTIIENVQETIDRERLEQMEYLVKKRISPRHTDDFQHFWSYDEINAYVRQMAQSNPTYVTLLTLGQSFENREILGLRITAPGDDSQRPIIYVDATIHAREWIAPMVAVYLIHELAEHTADHLAVLENVVWIIQPLVNPDGYVFTSADDGDRFWRKTRTVNEGTECLGVDANRNYDHYWANGQGAGVCTLTYAGTAPFSVAESRIVRDVVLQNVDRMKLYVSTHSYGSLFMYPFSSHSNIFPENYRFQHEAGDVFAEALFGVNETPYRVGNGAGILGISSGTSKDWVYSGPGVPLSYTLELPRGGTQGFDPPATAIEGVVTETFAGLRAIAEFVIERYYPLSN
ncbi:carboxypeptidase B1-like [Phlebotomus argentipes]|uniref:carboxypeptidase B1-like n=1 Tax=Phlebotomus argentipes TaxID=94469 RepID=UPI002892C37E|nr:carboxypeptidase B1-like [Phlebotomus argentipes]